MVEKLYRNIFEKDSNEREINIFKVENCSLSGDDIFYPNVKILSGGKIYNPINERIMSLHHETITDKINKFSNGNLNNFYDIPVFFFIYNTDNYYHFMYDSVPYLLSYFDLKKEIPNLKLLMNYPNFDKHEHYNFVIDFFNILNIKLSDIVIANTNTEYKTIFFSDSFTHGINSNVPPRGEVYEFYQNLKNKFNNAGGITPKKIYISRRTNVHNDFSNIGTNYTEKRKLINEDLLVKKLSKLGFVEIFTENLTLLEKINIFSNAEEIISPIGGGLVNVLFCNNTTKVYVITSPVFLEVNNRFLFCFKNVSLKLYDHSKHKHRVKFKPYVRVNCLGIIGEVIKETKKRVQILFSKNFVSGWNSQSKFQFKSFDKCECVTLDNGLNSPWYINTNKFLNFYLKK